MKIDLVKLSHLLAVARLRNFSRAADEMHITQPALSRSIAATERLFGVRIFDRGRGGVALTPAGAQVVAEAEALLRQARALEHNVRLYGAGEAGRCGFGMGPLVTELVLADLGRVMLAARPRLQMHVSTKTVAALHRELLADRIEFYFASSHQVPAGPDVAVDAIGTIDIAMMARADHPLAAREMVTLEDIAGFPAASSVELSAARQGIGALVCDSYHVLHQLALTSDAIWVSSPQLVGADLAAGRLVRLAVRDWLSLQSEIVVVRLRARTPSPAAAAIVGEVRGLFAAL